MIRTKVLKFCKKGKTRIEISDHLGLSPRQTRYIIKELAEEGVLKDEIVWHDMRMKRWRTIIERTPVTI